MSYLTRYRIYDKKDKLLFKEDSVCFASIRYRDLSEYYYIDLLLPTEKEVKGKYNSYEIYYLPEEDLLKSIETLNKIDAFKDKVSLVEKEGDNLVLRYYFDSKFLGHYQDILRPLSILRYLWETASLLKRKNAGWFYRMLYKISQETDYNLDYIVLPLEFIHARMVGAVGHAINSSFKIKSPISLLDIDQEFDNDDEDSVKTPSLKDYQDLDKGLEFFKEYYKVLISKIK